MKAHAEVVVECRRGRSRCTTLRSAPPITFRATPEGLHLVGTAAGPVGGDDLTLEVTVAPGASLTVRSVAAQLVLPAATPAASSMHLVIRVGAGGSLRWLPEPTILVRGADHHMATTIDLGPGADLVWRDEVVLGRHGEVSGSLRHRVRVERAGRPLLCTEVVLGPAWPASAGPAGVGDARVLASLLLVGVPACGLRERSSEEHPSTVGSTRRAAFPLADETVLLSVLGTDLDATRAALASWNAAEARAEAVGAARP